jgi:hypothetical protein
MMLQIEKIQETNKIFADAIEELQDKLLELQTRPCVG